MAIPWERVRKLVEALRTRENRFAYDLERLYDLAPQDKVDEVSTLTRELRDAVEFARGLRRLIPELTTAQIHRAFGAPGDWGYETPLGAALSEIYRSQEPEPALRCCDTACRYFGQLHSMPHEAREE